MGEKVAFTVTGQDKLHCEGCEQRVGNALRRLPGVQDVQASHQTQLIQVTIDPAQLDPQQVQARLEQIGYEVTAQGSTTSAFHQQ